MTYQDRSTASLPDVAYEAQPQLNGLLDWVGMNAIQVPILVKNADGSLQRCSARIDAHVNLEKADVRGIHMSRLYLEATRSLDSEALTPALLRRILSRFLESQRGLASRARLRIRFEQLVKRAALKSDHSGWRAYPISLQAWLGPDDFGYELATEILYSSTCPASAALSRQWIQRQFAARFGDHESLDRDAILAWLASEEGMSATPHAQRSVASVRVRPALTAAFDPVGLFDRIEAALGTPVQTAVKREDEQAFALANARNLLFCEDAARRVQRGLRQDADISDFAVRVSHEESLHPHNAVAYACKGVAGGYDAFSFAN